MDTERYPHYFLAVIVLYGVVFLAGLGLFILPSLGFGLAYGDFYLITALIFLPLILLGVYTRLEEFLSQVRLAVTVLTIIDFMLVLYFTILLI